MSTTNIVIFSLLGLTVIVIGGVIVYHYTKKTPTNPLSLKASTSMSASPTVSETTADLINRFLNNMSSNNSKPNVTINNSSPQSSSGRFKEGDCLMSNGKMKIGNCGYADCGKRDTLDINAGVRLGKFMYEAGGFIFTEGSSTIDSSLGGYINTFENNSPIIVVSKSNCQ